MTRKINIRIPISCRCLNHDSCRTRDVSRKLEGEGGKEDSTNEAVQLSVNTDILLEYNALNKICAILFVL